MMHERREKGLWIAAAAVVAAAIATPAFADKKDNSVRSAVQATPDNLDPFFTGGVIGIVIADHVWDALIYRNPDSGEYEGNLATAWRWIDDKTLELDLREGVKFHNGAQFDADDVVYSLKFLANPQNRTPRQDLARWIDRVEKIGKYKVRILAKQPYPPAITTLASANSAIQPHEYYAKVGSKGTNERPIGTGPFRVADYVLGKHIRFERNPDYFEAGPKSRPKIDKVELRFIPDPQTRVAEVVAGGLDLIGNVPRDQAEQLRPVQRLRIVSAETASYSYLQMNSLPTTQAAPLKDIRVRQAIMHAIDRETMAKYLVGEGAHVLDADCHPTQFGCTDSGVTRYPYDPGKARRLLAEAGLAAGFDLDIYAYADRNQIEAVIGYLSAVGIRAHMRFLQGAAVLSAMRAGRAPVVHRVFATAPDLAVGVGGSDRYEFSANDINRDPEIRDLFKRGDSSMDVDARKAAYGAALKLVADRAYVLPLYSVPTYYVAAGQLAFPTHADTTAPRFYEMSWK
jgi:peptide/nickel transport system substrate-binding protein